MASSPPYNGPPIIHYLFVDGGALRAKLNSASEKYFGSRQFDLAFRSLGTNFTKVFFYDALPVREQGEEESEYEKRIASQRKILDEAASIDGIHVYEGDARRRRKRGLEQKKVDVMITVDMLTHTFRRNMHRATLLTGDNDFKPLIDALIQEGMFVTLWYPIGQTSKELKDAADARRPFGVSALRNLLTTESQREFSVPVVTHKDFKNLVFDSEVKEWTVNGFNHRLYLNGDEYILVSVDGPESGRHITSKDKDLINEVWYESYKYVPINF